MLSIYLCNVKCKGIIIHFFVGFANLWDVASEWMLGIGKVQLTLYSFDGAVNLL